MFSESVGRSVVANKKGENENKRRCESVVCFADYFFDSQQSCLRICTFEATTQEWVTGKLDMTVHGWKLLLF